MTCDSLQRIARHRTLEVNMPRLELRIASAIITVAALLAGGAAPAMVATVMMAEAMRNSKRGMFTSKVR
jgi:hypothetical protein